MTVDTPAGIGLEPTLGEWVENIVTVGREIHRVLRDDGSFWLNLGDSYSSSNGQGRGTQSVEGGVMYKVQRPAMADLPAKNLMGQPSRAAFALQDAGWILRSAIVWKKTNPMPEPVTDRPTSAYEMVFLLTKQRRYFYDATAVREPVTGGTHARRKDGSHALRHGHDSNDNRATWKDSYQPTSTNARNVWTIPTQGRPDAHFACVDAETECLTAQGWKRHRDISDGDLAAQFDMETQTLSWGEVESVARYSVTNQEMVVCARRDLDMWLTPNHRCVIQNPRVRRRHPQTRKNLNPVIVRADELKPSHSIPTAANWLYQGVEPMSSDWAELLGRYIAEGYESKHSIAVKIYQSPSANPEKTKRIEELLQRVEAEYTSATGTRKWRGGDGSCTTFRVLGYAAVRLRELSPKKAIPSDVLLWSDHLIEAILKGLIEGAGREWPDGRRVFVQKNEQTANMVQAMVLRLGMSATCSIRADGIRQVYITKHHTRSFRTSGGEYQTSREGYTGIVWCPKTPNGTWVARRNGRAFITGNTYPDELPRRCILAGTSERGVCAGCGAPWARVVEKDLVSIASQDDRGSAMARTGFLPEGRNHIETLGWQPTCGCKAEVVPATVLDPFVGSGTTLAVAQALGRRSVGLDLNPEYLEIARRYINRADGITLSLGL